MHQSLEEKSMVAHYEYAKFGANPTNHVTAAIVVILIPIGLQCRRRRDVTFFTADDPNQVVGFEQ